MKLLVAVKPEVSPDPRTVDPHGLSDVTHKRLEQIPILRLARSGDRVVIEPVLPSIWKKALNADEPRPVLLKGGDEM